MAYKSLLTVLTDQSMVKGALAAAVALARRMDAHLDVLCLGIDQTQAVGFYPGSSIVLLDQTIQAAQEDAAALGTAARNLLQQEDVRWSIEDGAAPMAGLSQLVAERARYCDLLLALRPTKRNRDAESVIEAALFSGQIPVLLLPSAAPPQSWQHIVLGWDESNEALRAVRAALPLLQAAKSLSIAIIDPPTYGPERSDPGGALSQMLARHGVHAEISVLARTLPTLADELNRHVRDRGADLVVMGAYGHSRLREAVLGGATRGMMEQAEVAVFMAH